MWKIMCFGCVLGNAYAPSQGSSWLSDAIGHVDLPLGILLFQLLNDFYPELSLHPATSYLMSFALAHIQIGYEISFLACVLLSTKKMR